MILGALIGSNQALIFDEAQRIPSIGVIVKMIVDHFKGVQVLVTGSSALEPAGGVFESMTGRMFESTLCPISFEELADQQGYLKATSLLEHRLRYGFYPEVVTDEGREEEHLRNIRNGYLYKDILAYQQVKKPAVLEKLLRALALQVGGEVAYHEVGKTVGLDPHTVERYVDLLVIQVESRGEGEVSQGLPGGVSGKRGEGDHPGEFPGFRDGEYIPGPPRGGGGPGGQGLAALSFITDSEARCKRTPD